MKRQDVYPVIERLRLRYSSSRPRLIIEKNGDNIHHGYWGDLGWQNHDFEEDTAVLVLEDSIDESGGGSHNDLDYIQFPLSALEAVVRSALRSETNRDSALVEGRRVMYHEHWPYGSENGYTGPKLRCHVELRVSVELGDGGPTLQIEGPEIKYPIKQFTDLIK
jgi:hypothetical protein